MAPACISVRAAAAPASVSAAARRRPAAAAVSSRALLPTAAPLLLVAPAFFAASKRTTVLMRSSDSGEKNDDKLVTESGEIMQGRQEVHTGPMTEEKKAQTPEQGSVATPEAADKAAGTEGKGASEVASQESRQQEDRAPMQD
eukprot:GHRQ01001448.1.p2 GENE.GHRQ01001448.1~~GHRQ01001448.1.p2  ORF type:complete len:143 (+),score=49.31 GHRQ01001448.1:169-597(+)